ncbi:MULTISPECIES: PspC domain-containing protein [unclassified Salinibacterium]|uniref:PspC domain-containing protein n=1 Tax=unclassified Salinibacterium TaxID=2632331 RepID=UPI00141E082C|nr:MULTISPECIES: PspC domain-containing protein [unclassified Salinibacterium]
MELIRPKRGRVIAGVCVAVANRFGWNPTVVRILTLLSLILPGPQVVLYVILWIVIPGEKRG